MKKIIGYNGKTLEELKVVFHCQHCGCDFEAEHGEYCRVVTESPTWRSYCPSCHKQAFAERGKENGEVDIGDITKSLESEIFYQYNTTEVEGRDACEYHAMISEHTEILGQFLDYSGMDVEELKICLIRGYLSIVRGATIFLKQNEYENLIRVQRLLHGLV